jgi:hypothetical protein
MGRSPPGRELSDLRAPNPKVRGCARFSGVVGVPRAQSPVAPDIEYAAAYAVRMHTPGDQQVWYR